MNIQTIFIIIFIILLIVILYKNKENYNTIYNLNNRYPNNINMFLPYNPVYPYYGYYGYTNKRSQVSWSDPKRLRFIIAPNVMLSPDRYSPYYSM